MLNMGCISWLFLWSCKVFVEVLEDDAPFIISHLSIIIKLVVKIVHKRIGVYLLLL